MKSILAAVLLVGTVSFAQAGSIEVKVITAATPEGETVKTRVLDAQIARIIAAYGTAQVDTGTKDAQGAPIVRAPTRQETLTRWVTETFQTTKYRVQNHERDAPARAIPELNLGTVGTP